MASITFDLPNQGDETSARCGKEKSPIKYKIAIMLLHIHKFLLRAYHSMQSTLRCHQGSRGAIQQQWGEKSLALFHDGAFFLRCKLCYIVFKIFEGDLFHHRC